MKPEPLENKEMIETDGKKDWGFFMKENVASVHQWLKQHIRCPSSLWNNEKKYRKEMLKRGFVLELTNVDYCSVRVHKLDEYRQWLLNVAFTDVVKKKVGDKK